MDNRKYTMETFYRVRVDGRVFEDSKTPARRTEVIDILRQAYPNSEITVETKRQRKYV